MSTHTHASRVIHNSGRQLQAELYANKHKALYWFRKWTAFKTIDPDKTYAQALRTNSAREISTVNEGYKNVSASKVKNREVKLTNKVIIPSRDSVNSTSHSTKYLAKRTRVLHNTKNVPVSLHNRFQVLTDQSDKDNASVEDNTPRRTSATCSVDHSTTMEADKRSFQHSQECKHPSTLGVTQPLLAEEANFLLLGNKNGNGHFVGNIDHTEPHSDDTGCKVSSDFGSQIQLSDNVLFHEANSPQQNYTSGRTEVNIGTKSQPQLADPKISFLGNKNGTGHFDGVIESANIFAENNCEQNVENCSDDSHIMGAALQHQVLNGNYSLNTNADIQPPQTYPKNTEYGNAKQHCFGFIPKSHLQIYNGKPKSYDVIPDIIQTHIMVRNSGSPNFLGCRIPVKSNLKCDIWDSYLAQYWDQQLPDLLRYGFPLDFDRNSPLMASEQNHTSAIRLDNHVTKYIKEELHHEAILGPFQSKPITLHTSPLMVRDKQDSDTKRTIMDLSWPLGLSVNQGVTKDIYLGTEFELKYPSVDHITATLRKLGPAAMIYKIDISRAFRQIKVDPGDIDLLGFKFKDEYFIDLSVAFGYRNGSLIFQKCTDAIRFIMSQHGFPYLHNYIDDLIYIGLPSEIYKSYSFLLDLLAQLGLDISMKKLVPPTTAATCLGIHIDTIDRTISIPSKKLQEIITICKNLQSKTHCSKRDLQSLLGSLLYITKCVAPARSFLNRMLQLLRDNVHNSKILLNDQFFKDLAWFNTFLENYNGVTFYDLPNSNIEVHLDACLTGLGGHFGNLIYTLPIPLGFKDYDITQLEMLNIVVAAKIWASHWANKRIRIFSDNMAVVQVLTTGKARDQVLATCARNIWLIAALNNIQFQFSHIPGKNNVLADLLSRWNYITNPMSKLQSLITNYVWIPTHLTLTCLNYSI